MKKFSLLKTVAFLFHKYTDKKHEYFRSYSQSGEDLIIQYLFKCLKIENPYYIDIGAHHPHFLNNTAIFYNKGGTGINIEPDQKLFNAFRKHRKRDVNLNVGVGMKSGNLDFYVMSAPTMNTFSKEEADNLVENHNLKIVEVKKIPVITIDELTKKYFKNKNPDFLSLDVEGVDEEILASINFKIFSPTVVCVETMSYSTTGHSEKNETILKLLQENGYMIYADTHINTIFVKKEKWLR